MTKNNNYNIGQQQKTKKTIKKKKKTIKIKKKQKKK